MSDNLYPLFYEGKTRTGQTLQGQYVVIWCYGERLHCIIPEDANVDVNFSDFAVVPESIRAIGRTID